MPPKKIIKPRRLQTTPDSGQRWFESFIEYLRNECHMAENTVLAYSRDLRAFGKWRADQPLTQLTIQDLSDYAAWLHGLTLAPASIARNLVAIKIFFRYLHLEAASIYSPAE